MTYAQYIRHYKTVMNEKFLNWFFFQRGEIHANSGYSPTHHHTCVNLMIIKNINEYELSKQRILGILDSEFNHNN